MPVTVVAAGTGTTLEAVVVSGDDTAMHPLAPDLFKAVRAGDGGAVGRLLAEGVPAGSVSPTVRAPPRPPSTARAHACMRAHACNAAPRVWGSIGWCGVIQGGQRVE